MLVSDKKNVLKKVRKNLKQPKTCRKYYQSENEKKKMRDQIENLTRLNEFLQRRLIHM